MNDWEDPRERRARLAKEVDLFKGLRERASGTPEQKKTHQQHLDEIRNDAERRKAQK